MRQTQTLIASRKNTLLIYRQRLWRLQQHLFRWNSVAITCDTALHAQKDAIFWRRVAAFGGRNAREVIVRDTFIVVGLRKMRKEGLALVRKERDWFALRDKTSVVFLMFWFWHSMRLDNCITWLYLQSTAQIAWKLAVVIWRLLVTLCI